MRPRAALVAAAALAGLVPAPPAAAVPAAAAAITPTHVAIVIAGHGVGCVRWHSGITGDEVLNAVATVRYRPTDGLITQIDGQPRNNVADETHYWSYWHNTGSGWRYSTAGAGSYQPKAGTVEGWHFMNGSDTATPPRLRSYAGICHDTAVPSPPPAAPTSSAATTHAATHATTRTANAPTTSVAGTSTTRAAGTTAAAGAGHPGRPAPSRSAEPSRTKATQAAPALPSAPVTTTSAPAADLPTLRARATAEARADQGSALPTVLVVTLVLLLGGGAALVAQRRRRST